MPKLKIQFVVANAFPEAALRVDEEIRAIELAFFRLGSLRPKTYTAPAARLKDVIHSLDTNRPQVVHFSAHGSPISEIVLIDDYGEPDPIPSEAMSKLFAELKGEIRLVFLNFCYSRPQAEAISQSIDCVIGVDKTISDVSALQYSAQFYEMLATGKSVAQAHEIARILLFGSRVPPSEQPTLISRADVDPLSVFFVPQKKTDVSGKKSAKTTRPIKTAMPAVITPSQSDGDLQFSEACELYGVWADSVSVTKSTLTDGSSILRFEIEGLQVQRDSLDGFHYFLASEAGLIGSPIPDTHAINLGVDWNADALPEVKTIDELLQKVSTLNGAFRFGAPLMPGNSYSFGWSVRVLNSDALNVWEFRNLYSPEHQLHVNRRQLNPPREYYAQLVWFPVRKLALKVQMPDPMPRPELKYFELLEKTPIPRDDIVSRGLLWSYPPHDSAWFHEHGKWQSNFEIESRHANKVRAVGNAGSEILVEFPSLGSYYSFDSLLPNTELSATLDDLARGAKQVRNGLLEHRQKRKTGDSDSLCDQIRNTLKALYDSVGKYRSSSRREHFQLNLMTYDETLRRLLVVEGVTIAGDVRSWEFWLPFGLGLAGSCFRNGDRAFRYIKELEEHDNHRPENYLPLPGSIKHECLLALPIDHPQLTKGDFQLAAAERCRQLVGVVTIGSDHKLSPLLPLCRDSLTEVKLLELRDLRDLCQVYCDQISSLLLTA